MANKPAIIFVDAIEPKILTVRGHKVMLDSDLAVLYGTTTKVLNQAVKRNAGRFPDSFMFTLTSAEFDELVTNCDRFKKLRHSSSPPKAFTEHGAIMAASILNTPRAVEVSILVVQAFVKLRQFALNHEEILKKLTDLERTATDHDVAIKQIVLTLRRLMTPPSGEKPKRRIGFHTSSDDRTQAKRKQ